MTKNTIDFDPKQVAAINASEAEIVAVQQCLLCENSRELFGGVGYSQYPWVCNECKESIEFLKFLKTHDQDLMRLIMESKK